MVFRVLFLLSIAFSSFGAEVAGVKLEDKDRAANAELTLNGKSTGLPITGEDFYRALLRVWLSDNPVQADLKKALLGEKP